MKEVARDSSSNVLYADDYGNIVLSLNDKGKDCKLGKLSHLTNKDGIRRKTFFASPKKRSKHFMRKNSSWGLCNMLINFLEFNKVDDIVLFDKESKKHYHSKVDDWINDGTFLHFKLDDLELQRFLAEDKFQIIK